MCVGKPVFGPAEGVLDVAADQSAAHKWWLWRHKFFNALARWGRAVIISFVRRECAAWLSIDVLLLDFVIVCADLFLEVLGAGQNFEICSCRQARGGKTKSNVWHSWCRLKLYSICLKWCSIRIWHDMKYCAQKNTRFKIVKSISSLWRTSQWKRSAA